MMLELSTVKMYILTGGGGNVESVLSLLLLISLVFLLLDCEFDVR